MTYFKKTKPNVICKGRLRQANTDRGRQDNVKARRQEVKESRRLRTYLLVLEHPQTLTQAAEGGSRRGLQ